MKVGEAHIEWDFGWQLAADILRSITLLSDKTINRIDGDGFKAYWAGTVLRIDIPESELR